MFSIKTLFRTFEALRGTCFLQSGMVFTFDEPDEFTDLLSATKRAQQMYESDDEDFMTQDTLGKRLELKYKYLKLKLILK